MSCSSDGTVKIWELSSGECLETIDSNADCVFLMNIKYIHFVLNRFGQ